jgi:hypothetical protein
MEANYRQRLDQRPNLAVLPWGATEAHNFHLPHGTDVIEAAAIAEACSWRSRPRRRGRLLTSDGHSRLWLFSDNGASHRSRSGRDLTLWVMAVRGRQVYRSGRFA